MHAHAAADHSLAASGHSTEVVEAHGLCIAECMHACMLRACVIEYSATLSIMLALLLQRRQACRQLI